MRVPTKLLTGIVVIAGAVVTLAGAAMLLWWLAFFVWPSIGAMTAPTVVLELPDGFRGPFHIVESKREGRLTVDESGDYTIPIPPSGTAFVPADSALREAHQLKARYRDKTAIETGASQDPAGTGVRDVNNWYTDDSRFVSTYVVGTRAEEDFARRQRFVVVNGVVVAE